ncbi:MAG: LysM peptidoglycan-binding domain-containing protein [Planctomycetes bacterium]|nr:LysM peptidoglycan-binding domain-containing protein [Planctomycetota bacterium]
MVFTGIRHWSAVRATLRSAAATVAVCALAACKGTSEADQSIPEEPVGYDSSYDSSADDSRTTDTSRAAATLMARTHIVKKGDTLFALARQYYADVAQWRRILEANSGRIANKDQLKIGQELVIPE